MKRGENLFKHGLTGTSEHRSWMSMITRCHGSDASREDFHLYQGKGIRVCDRWREFVNFLADMGPKPTNRHSIERLDSTRDYEPGNCIWATPKQQANNTTRNRKIPFNGETLTLAGWSERLGINKSTLSERLEKWPVDVALTLPAVRRRERDERGFFAKASAH